MVELGTAPLTVTVQLEDKARDVVAELAAPRASKDRIVLNLEGVWYDRNPGGSYEIYLNLPEGQEPDYQSEYYVGSIGLFGLERYGHSHGSTAASEHPSHSHGSTAASEHPSHSHGSTAASEHPSHSHGSTTAPEHPLVQLSFDITRVVRALQTRGEWNEGQVSVTFIKRDVLPPAGSEIVIEEKGVEPEERVHIERVVITTEQSP